MKKLKIDCFFGSDTYSHIEIKSAGKSGSKIVFLFSQEDEKPISLGVVLSEEKLCLKEKKDGFLEIIKLNKESGELTRFNSAPLSIKCVDKKALIRNIDNIYEIKVQKAPLTEVPLGSMITHRRRKKINVRPSFSLGMREKREKREKRQQLVMMQRDRVRA